eukprot:GGOE01022011.1.p2 GENE.GGOE01022011.1~~GGOE01022011.1.p2  ORF type:complete len:185 (+),score=0.72 GGOE01022011.1:67-555(+)
MTAASSFAPVARSMRVAVYRDHPFVCVGMALAQHSHCVAARCGRDWLRNAPLLNQGKSLPCHHGPPSAPELCHPHPKEDGGDPCPSLRRFSAPLGWLSPGFPDPCPVQTTGVSEHPNVCVCVCVCAERLHLPPMPTHLWTRSSTRTDRSLLTSPTAQIMVAM